MSETDDLATGNAPAEGRWAFDESVAASFEDMLARSIPDYASMRKMVTDAACWFIDQARQAGLAPHVVDLGCSRGDALAGIVDRAGAAARYYGVEMSEPMLAAAHERFAGWEESGRMRLIHADLREGFPPGIPPATVILSVLTLQFVPIEHRQRLVQSVHDRLADGGALILVEKVLGATARLDSLEADLYWGLKRENGYTQEAIERKRLSLEGVLVPVTAKWNEELLAQAGFRQVDQVWRWCNFAGWIAVKG